MSKLSSYLNEIISFLVMFLMLAALVSGQLSAPGEQLASAGEDSTEITHTRMHRE
jgi:hypothetical protein